MKRLERPVQRLRPNRREPGAYFLVEYLIYLAVTMIILGFGFAAFYRGMANSRDLNRNSEDIVGALRAGERWRSDIRIALAVPTSQAENGVVEFLIPQEAGDVVYRFESNSVWRITTDRPPYRILARVAESVMEADARTEVTAWRWSVELVPVRKTSRVRPVFTFAAVPENEEVRHAH